MRYANAAAHTLATLRTMHPCTAAGDARTTQVIAVVIHTLLTADGVSPSCVALRDPDDSFSSNGITELMDIADTMDPRIEVTPYNFVDGTCLIEDLHNCQAHDDLMQKILDRATSRVIVVCSSGPYGLSPCVSVQRRLHTLIRSM